MMPLRSASVCQAETAYHEYPAPCRIQLWQGADILEGNYGVHFGGQLVGKVQVLRQGLYYRFVCRCRLTGGIVCRLAVRCGGKREYLGVLVPMDGGFGIDTRLPVKRFEGGTPEFTLVPRHEPGEGKYVPIYPEEPFAYIERLKDAYLVRKDGQIGAVIK